MVTETNHEPFPAARAQALTLAFLRFGSDTRGPRVLKELTRSSGAGEPADILSPVPPVLDRPEHLADALGIPPDEQPEKIRAAKARAAEALERSVTSGIGLMTWWEPTYPDLLREIVDPPIVLWHVGDVASILRPSVAIVGSRRATPAGLDAARRLARGLARAGLVVASGMARGIDAAAHQAALDAGGQTVAVLGCGADVVYPREHGALAERIRRAGAILSEFPPGMPPLAHHFPLRNRIISGLSRAVVVVEASERSGSLITARAALEQGRDVLAVPGNVVSGQYGGCHALIKDGAPLVETTEDVLQAIGWLGTPGAASEIVQSYKPHKESYLEALMARGEAYTVDQLAARTGRSAADLLGALGMLEIAGRVVKIPGAGFVKADNSAIGDGNG